MPEGRGKKRRKPSEWTKTGLENVRLCKEEILAHQTPDKRAESWEWNPKSASSFRSHGVLLWHKTRVRTKFGLRWWNCWGQNGSAVLSRHKGARQGGVPQCSRLSDRPLFRIIKELSRRCTRTEELHSVQWTYVEDRDSSHRHSRS